jgi:hypothetical protein
MTFEEAVAALKGGNEVTRSDWNGAWLFAGDDQIMVNSNVNAQTLWEATAEDLEATDWSVVSKGAASAIGFGTA